MSQGCLAAPTRRGQLRTILGVNFTCHVVQLGGSTFGCFAAPLIPRISRCLDKHLQCGWKQSSLAFSKCSGCTLLGDHLVVSPRRSIVWWFGVFVVAVCICVVRWVSLVVRVIALFHFRSCSSDHRGQRSQDCGACTRDAHPTRASYSGFMCQTEVKRDARIAHTQDKTEL